MSLPNAAARAVTVVSVIARIAAGTFWIAESIVKYRAGFGEADILLVADGAAGNSRVPGWFTPVDALMHAFPTLFGLAMPLLEGTLGLLLILGVVTRAAAFASVCTLMLYWASDQLIAQYPIMVVLATIVVASPRAARLGVGEWWRARGDSHPRRTSLGWRS